MLFHLHWVNSKLGIVAFTQEKFNINATMADEV